MGEGKLIVIEGTDSSGKATQTELMYQKLKSEGKRVMKLDFPNYKSDSSIFVKKYLRGEFGVDSESIDPYIASTFYTLDRYETYKKEIEDFYLSGGLLISDRYTTANMVHQASKISCKKERDKYLNWIWDFEFNIFKLPIPDKVIFLDLPTKYTGKLNEKRKNKIDGSATKDIHESNIGHLEKAYKNAKYVANKYGWKTIICVEKDKIKGINEIHELISKEIAKTIYSGGLNNG